MIGPQSSKAWTGKHCPIINKHSHRLVTVVESRCAGAMIVSCPSFDGSAGRFSTVGWATAVSPSDRIAAATIIMTSPLGSAGCCVIIVIWARQKKAWQLCLMSALSFAHASLHHTPVAQKWCMGLLHQG